MARKSKKQQEKKGPVDREAESRKTVERLAKIVQREVRKRLGPDATFEQQNDAAAALMNEVLWKREDETLQEAVTDDEEVDVDGKRYRRLAQDSSATYYGRWGPHGVSERLYREVGVRNGETVKPIELRVGIIAGRMMPDFARIVGDLGADHNSREVEKILRTVGLVPPGRAFLEKRGRLMAGEIASQVDALEQASRTAVPLPAEIASVSCGLDRFSVRMTEPAGPDATDTGKRRRTRPYKRKQPPAKEHHFRKAWAGSTSIYDKDGNVLHTWRCAAEPGIEPKSIAKRVAADVAWVLQSHPDVPVHCVQDAAPELRALPEVLDEKVPDAKRRELVDFEHLMGYLDAVVDACEPDGDPFSMKSWYRGELLRDDQAIDRIYRGLRDRARRLPGRDSKERNAVAAALSYIRNRKDKMRYASLHAANLPIGSGATESTCWTMQQRVKRPAQSWKVPGLRGALAVRGLVHSDRWCSAWQPYAARHRKEVRSVA